MIANPSWNTWCLSNSELQDMFQTNKAVSEFLSTWFITVDGKLEASVIAGAIYGIASDGWKSLSYGQLGRPIAEAALKKLNLSKNTAQKASRAFLVAVIIASVLKQFTNIETKRAKEELFRRGLLKVEDL